MVLEKVIISDVLINTDIVFSLPLGETKQSLISAQKPAEAWFFCAAWTLLD